MLSIAVFFLTDLANSKSNANLLYTKGMIFIYPTLRISMRNARLMADNPNPTRYSTHSVRHWRKIWIYFKFLMLNLGLLFFRTKTTNVEFNKNKSFFRA
jgi:hypothetical protein